MILSVCLSPPCNAWLPFLLQSSFNYVSSFDFFTRLFTESEHTYKHIHNHTHKPKTQLKLICIQSMNSLRFLVAFSQLHLLTSAALPEVTGSTREATVTFTLQQFSVLRMLGQTIKLTMRASTMVLLLIELIPIFLVEPSQF